MNKVEKLVIIGSGPAGLTAGVYASRANLQPLIIEGREPGGQLMTTSAVENWPGDKSILGPTLMQNMRTQVIALGTRFHHDEVTCIDLTQRPFLISFRNSSALFTKSLIIATGAQPRRLGCSGEDMYWGKGVSSCAVCDAPFFKDKEVVIVGGGDSAMESASFLSSYAKKITIVHILGHLTASHAMQQRILKNPNIEIIYETTVTQILGENGRVSGVALTNQNNGQSSLLSVQGVFVAIGIIPNTSIFKEQLELDRYGYIVLKKYTETSVAGVFAAGDVADNRYRQAITSAGTGCAAALDAERYLNEVD